MTNEYLAIGVLLLVSTILAVLVVIIGHSFGPRRPSARKNAPYESGMVPIGPGTRRVPVRFYMVAVLFILFDIEVIFFLPYAMVVRELSWYGILGFLVFNIPIIVGFLYEWKKGALEWE